MFSLCCFPYLEAISRTLTLFLSAAHSLLAQVFSHHSQVFRCGSRSTIRPCPEESAFRDELGAERKTVSRVGPFCKVSLFFGFSSRRGVAARDSSLRYRTAVLPQPSAPAWAGPFHAEGRWRPVQATFACAMSAHVHAVAAARNGRSLSALIDGEEFHLGRRGASL